MKKYAVIVDWNTLTASIVEYDDKITAQLVFNILKESGIYTDRVILVEVIESFNG